MWMSWMLVAGVALAADGARPAMLSVVTLDEETPCPTVQTDYLPGVVQTSVGLAIHRGDGTYAFGCPSAWQDDPSAPFVASPTGTEIFSIPNGVPHMSSNGGCTVKELPLPEGLDAVDLIYWREAFWVLAAASDLSDAGELFKWQPATDALPEGWTSVQRWTTDFRPDNMTDGGAASLWIVASEPRLRIRRLTFDNGLADSGILGNMPDGFDGAEVVVQAADDDEAWFVLRRASRAWTWHAQVVNNESRIVVFTEMPYKGAFVAGPVKFDGFWVAALNSKLAYAPENPTDWTITEHDAPWTCLDTRGNRVFACTVPAILAVEAVTTDQPPVTSEVFSFYQLVEPDTTCSNDTCDADFANAVLSLPFDLPEEPGICPDGTTETELFGAECGCDTPSRGAAWSIALLALMGLRRRQSPAPRQM